MPVQTPVDQELSALEHKLKTVTIPPDLQEKTSLMLKRLRWLAKSGTYSKEYEKVSHYLDWIIKLPWQKQSSDTIDLSQAKQVLDKHHYGLKDLKERILQYLSVIKLKQNQGEISSSTHAPVICLIGLVGTGKTTFAKSIADVMGRSFARIPFGGMGSVKDIRGQSRLHLDSQPGRIIKALIKTQVKNPVILLDEIDRVTTQSRADIMGVLLELLDPEQNASFLDYYIDYPVNLSQVLFVATANNTTNISTAVLDRLEILTMPSYTDSEKITIAKNYLLPQALTDAGLKTENLTIESSLWPQIVRPLGFDAGIRTLSRTIQGIILKLAKEIVEGKHQSLHLSQANIKSYLPTY